MQYEISGSVLAGQITTTTWAGAPSRTWAWSRAIGGAGRGIGGAGRFASWTRAAQLRTSTWAEAAVARATVPPRRSTLRRTCPGRALGEGSGRSGLGAPWTRAAQLATSAWAVAPSRTWAWSRAIGGAGRGIGGAGRLASWTRAAQLAAFAWAEAAVARATVPPQAFNSAVDLPRARLGRRQRSIGPGRAVDQGGSARDVGLGGGSVEDLGMNASTLERIRFAAANRLCVDVGYEGDVQRVEPYSLRKARGGNVVLYACEAGSSECATYRTGGISEVEVTRQTFVLKYANELLSPGR